MATINDDDHKIMLRRGFNSSPNFQLIFEYVFELFKDIVYLTEMYIGNVSKGFSESTASNRTIIFGFCRTNVLK